MFPSNNDFCVCIGLHDRRYFILDTDDSNANDQEYYTFFRNYCIDPETATHVYRYLMSIDITDFNPRTIPETEEKQLYRENAVPISIHFLQNLAERSINEEFCTWQQLILPDTLFQLFCRCCDRQN